MGRDTPHTRIPLHCTSAVYCAVVAVLTRTAVLSCVPYLGKVIRSGSPLPLAPNWRLEPRYPSVDGAGPRQRLPGNALFVGAGGGAGAVTHSGVMRAGAAPGSLAGGPGGWRGPAAGALQPPSARPRPVGKRRSKFSAPGRASNPGPASSSQSVTSLHCCLSLLISKMEASLQVAVTPPGARGNWDHYPGILPGSTFSMPKAGFDFLGLWANSTTSQRLNFPIRSKEVARTPYIF